MDRSASKRTRQNDGLETGLGGACDRAISVVQARRRHHLTLTRRDCRSLRCHIRWNRNSAPRATTSTRRATTPFASCRHEQHLNVYTLHLGAVPHTHRTNDAHLTCVYFKMLNFHTALAGLIHKTARARQGTATGKTDRCNCTWASLHRAVHSARPGQSCVQRQGDAGHSEGHLGGLWFAKRRCRFTDDGRAPLHARRHAPRALIALPPF